jgi:hypothetical protein
VTTSDNPTYIAKRERNYEGITADSMLTTLLDAQSVGMFWKDRESSADCITNMSGFDLRQAQVACPRFEPIAAAHGSHHISCRSPINAFLKDLEEVT